MSLRRYWMLVDEMARMSLKAGASRFFLGYLWWVLEPLLYVAVFYIVFDVLLDSRRADFLVFLMCGKLTFIWFSKSVVLASRSIVGAKGLIGRIDLPKSLFPIASVQESSYKQIAVFALLLLFLLARGYAASIAWLWLLPLIAVNYLLIVAASLAGAYLVCLARDFTLLIGLAMTFLLFMSGIFWDPRSLADPAMTEILFTLNPVAFLIDAYRQVLMAGLAPDTGRLLWLAAGAGAATFAMLVITRRSSQFLALRAITS
jgi:lipopolysaccharide transport system permease protein